MTAMQDTTAIPLDAETKVAERPGDHQAELRLWLRLLTCTNLIETEIRRRLREEFNVTLPRFDLLAQLDRAEEGLSLGEVSRRLMVSAANITAIVEKLVEDGYITRVQSPTDRRAQIIRMTHAGRSAFRTPCWPLPTAMRSDRRAPAAAGARCEGERNSAGSAA